MTSPSSRDTRSTTQPDLIGASQPSSTPGRTTRASVKAAKANSSSIDKSGGPVTARKRGSVKKQDGQVVLGSGKDVDGSKDEMENLSRKSQWIVLAIASGTCAAFNGVFAKLTTTELTSTFALSIARVFGLKDGSTIVEALVRGTFFALNLVFNGIMWTLFTKALARGTSTTQVTILNTSSNFLFTALLGLLIFSESLPPQWFFGAVLLVTGNVIIGRREEKDVDEDGEGRGVEFEDGAGGLSGESEGLMAASGVAERGEGFVDAMELDDEFKAHEDREREDLIDLGRGGSGDSPKITHATVGGGSSS